MHLFIDNWSASLLAPATGTAVSLSVEPAKAALLTGLGTGDFYRLTLVDVDPSGAEIDWDVVEVTAVAAGVLTVTRTATARSWSEGAIIEARLTAAGMEDLRDTAGGAAVGSDMPQALGSAAPGASPQASRQDHVHPAPTPGDIGAATAAQGAKADSAVQPAALTTALADKVDKVAGKGLSSNDFTTGEKDKLAGLESSHFKGLHASLAALQSALPSAVAGDYADVDAGAGVDVVRYLWDVTDSQWVAQAAAGGGMTPAQVKTAYESNPDTNAFTDAEQAKLAGIAAGATANADTDSLAEGVTNKYFTEGRVRSTVLTGLSLQTGGVISAADSMLSAQGKLQKQISDAVTAIGGKQDTLVSGTNLKTVNGNSLIGAGDLAISGSASLAQVAAYAGTAKTLGLTDINTIVDCTSSSAVTITIPPQSSVAWTADAEIHVRMSGTGVVSIAVGAGVTIPPLAAPIALSGQGAIVTLKRRSSDVWALVGAIQGDQTITGSLDFSGDSRRLSALMDASANAFAVQTNVTNGLTAYDVIPNGTSTTSQLRIHNKAARTGQYFVLAASNTGLGIFSGGSSPLPLSFSIGLAASWLVDNASPYAFRPGADNTQPLGTASFRASVIYAGTGTINTSDAREKTEVRALTAAEIEASKQLAKEVGAYRFLSAVAEKGDAAREHIGMTVQRAIEVMEQHGLDPFGYGFICYDEWGELPELTEEEALGVVTDADGVALTYDVPDPGEAMPEGATWIETRRETVVVSPYRAAGNRYSFRPDELLLFIARGFDARLEALETAA